MLDVSWSNAYKQDYKRAKKRGLNMKKLDDVIDALRQGQELPAHCRPHPLSGKYHDVMECHIESDWLLVYQIRADVLCLYLMRTGTHQDLFEHK
ncbi:MAG: type II toxin-antitoxin system YafQ family toxin [Schwartzia sp.]|nr:type II toxin-antitoxin system YafQ family toxin [Schwartzia sp. (in: firmicutes)]